MLSGLRKFAVGAIAAATALAAVAQGTASLEERAAAGNRLVFCHFMVSEPIGILDRTWRLTGVDWYCW